MSAWMNSVYTCWFTNTVYVWFRCILMYFAARFSIGLLLMASIHSSILIHGVLSRVARLLRWCIISYWNLWLDFYLQLRWQTVPWHASTKPLTRKIRCWEFWSMKLFQQNYGYIFNGMFLYEIIIQDSICPLNHIITTFQLLSSQHRELLEMNCPYSMVVHDDVIKWKHFPRYWPFVRGIHRSPVNSPHKGQWRGAFMFSLIFVWINGWVINREAGDLRRYRAHYDVTVMPSHTMELTWFICS